MCNTVPKIKRQLADKASVRSRLRLLHGSGSLGPYSDFTDPLPDPDPYPTDLSAMGVTKKKLQ
jgi:hypothetical protein